MDMRYKDYKRQGAAVNRCERRRPLTSLREAEWELAVFRSSSPVAMRSGGVGYPNPAQPEER
jgi:hypothetical protein